MPNQKRHIAFIYTEESIGNLEPVSEHSPDVIIQSSLLDDFLQNPDTLTRNVDHIVVSAPMAGLKSVIRIAIEHDLSIGILPLKSQKTLSRYFRLPDDPADQIELALQEKGQTRDLILCNGELVLFKAVIGRIPVIDLPDNLGPWKTLQNVLARFRGIRLLGFTFVTESGRKVETAAAGCMIVQHTAGSLASRLIANDGSSHDAMISLVIAAPLSVLDYFRFLFQVLKRDLAPGKIPSAIGYIKSSRVVIESEESLGVDIDGEEITRTPVECEVRPGALRVNTGPKAETRRGHLGDEKEYFNIKHLPIDNELTKAKKKAIPFFPYASEERFKDLFVALRDDARMSSAYVMLMLLSTLLATIGLYQNSTAVVIGAMLLAPLMSPIISFAMGMLRQDQGLYQHSAVKIMVGIALALGSAALVTMLFPHKPVTNEMLGRLSPSLLDLGVAIFAGIAGAYTKSYKEILQSLAGVAIAVALVPPLAVAGIGLGRGDPYFFGQAFLLFSTNLVGIIVFAALTFWMLGYSAAIKGKRSMGSVVLVLALITVPLYITYEDFVEKIQWELSWQKERFLVNGKYIIVRKAEILRQRDRDIVLMDIMARERLSRDDLDNFKQKVQTNFSRKLVIRANIIYIL